MKQRGFYFSVEPHPEDDNNLVVRICSPKEQVRTLLPLENWWPWEEEPVGGLQQYTYQLSSDQQHHLGCHKLYCIAERETANYGGQAWFFRHLLPGRAVIFGLTDDLRIHLLDHEVEHRVREWFAYMQGEWCHAYDRPTHPGVQTVN